MKSSIARIARLAPVLALFAMGQGCAHSSVSVTVAPSDLHIREATVQILHLAEDATGVGTGAVVGPGLVLTNHHVLEPSDDDGNPANLEVSVACTVDGGDIRTCFKFDVVAVDRRYDLALIRVHGPMAEPVSIDDGPLEEGEEVFARLSLSLLLPPAKFHGRVLGRTGPPIVPGPRRLILDLGANGGASGGPVYRKDGRLIGLIQAVTTFPGRPHSIAVSARDIKAFLKPHLK